MNKFLTPTRSVCCRLLACIHGEFKGLLGEYGQPRQQQRNITTLSSKVDLVKAAVAEYDFLQLIDKNPKLYTTPLLEHAIYRYETYWLPIAHHHTEKPLPAPFDVEWVWHCHILSPVTYAVDCKKLYGELIDHRPWLLAGTEDERQDLMEQSEQTWSDWYPGVPFEIDLTQSVPRDFHRSCSYDLAKACQRQRVFNYNTSLPHFRDSKFLKEAVVRYETMLKIKRDHPATFVVPFYDIDLVWHAHQMYPLSYMSDTTEYLGKILDHDDSVNDRSSGSFLSKSFLATKKLWPHGESFAIAGAMYRGDPPFPAIDLTNNNPQRRLLSFKAHIKAISLKLEGFHTPGIYNIIMYRIDSNDKPHVMFTKTAKIDGSEYELVNLNLPYQLSTRNEKALKITCSEQTVGHFYDATISLHDALLEVDVPDVAEQGSKGERTHASFLLSASPGSPDSISASLDCVLENKLHDIGYFFHIKNVIPEPMRAHCLRNVLQNVKLMAPTKFQEHSNNTSKCKYLDHELQTDGNLKAFSLRVIRCKEPALSAVELYDVKDNIVATVHSIDTSSLPRPDQVSSENLSCFTHDPKFDHAFLIRGNQNDWGILKVQWNNLMKGAAEEEDELGDLELDLLLLDGKNSQWISTERNADYTKRCYNVGNNADDKLFGEGFAEYDLGGTNQEASIKLPPDAQDIPQWVALGCAIWMAFDECGTGDQQQRQQHLQSRDKQHPGLLDYYVYQQLLEREQQHQQQHEDHNIDSDASDGSHGGDSQDHHDGYDGHSSDLSHDDGGSFWEKWFGSYDGDSSGSEGGGGDGGAGDGGGGGGCGGCGG